jgi:hypothetical protein
MDQRSSRPNGEAILVFWRIKRRDRSTLVCTLQRTAEGLEVWAGIEGEEAIWTALVRTHAEAVSLAAEWRIQFKTAE